MASQAAAGAGGDTSTTAAASTATPLSLCTPAEAAAASLNASAWRFEGWLHTWPLNPHTVLDYFKHSDFYDKTCNNEIAIMQTMQADSLKLMEGIEYGVDPMSTDDFFLIRKVYRVDPNTTQLLALYVVIGVQDTGDPMMPPRGTVFPMPDLHTVVKTNLATSLLYLAEAFEDLQSHAQFHPAVQGYQWNFDEKKSEETSSSSTTTATAAATPAAIAVDPAVAPRNQFAGLIDAAILKISAQAGQR